MLTPKEMTFAFLKGALHGVLFCVVFYVLSVLTATRSDALTQAEVQQAVYAALTTVPLNMSGAQVNVVPWLFPSIQSLTIGEYLMKVTGADDSNTRPSQGTILDNLQVLRQTLLSYGVLTSNVDRAVTELESLNYDFETFRSSWGSHAWSVEKSLSDLGEALGAVRSIGSRIEGAAVGLTNSVHTITNQLDRMLDFNDSVADGNVTFTVDLNTEGEGFDLIDNVRISVDQILDLSEEYEYQLQNIGATLQLLYEWFENNGSNVEIENYLSAIATRLDGVAGSLTNVISVSVAGFEDGLAITNWPTTLSDTAWWDDMRALSYARNATLDDTYDAVTNLSGFASNIMASIVITPESQRQFEQHTNSVEVALSTNVAADTLVLDQMPSTVSNAIEGYQVDLTDRFNRNPYDSAYTMSETFSETMQGVLETGEDGGYDPELVLFGSDDRPVSRGARPDLAVRLPRLVVNLDTMTSRWHSISLLRSVMILVWQLIGFAFKAMVLRDFLVWYSQREKKV